MRWRTPHSPSAARSSAAAPTPRSTSGTPRATPRDALAAGGGRTARRLQAARAQTVAQRKVIGAEAVVFDSAKELVDQPVDTSTPLERKFAALEAEAEAAARAAAEAAAAAAADDALRPSMRRWTLRRRRRRREERGC